MYQSRDVTNAVYLITTTENAKEKKFAHYGQETTAYNSAQLHQQNTNR